MSASSTQILPPRGETELPATTQALLHSGDRAGWLSRCASPSRRWEGQRLAREGLARLDAGGVVGLDPAQQDELRQTLEAALRSAREEGRRQRFLPLRLAASGASGMLGALAIFSLLGLAWRAMEPVPTVTVTTGRAASERRVATFSFELGSGDGGVGGSSPGDLERPGQPLADEFPEGEPEDAKVAVIPPERGQEEVELAGAEGEEPAPWGEEGSLRGQELGEALTRVLEPEALGEDGLRASGTGGWEGAGDGRHLPGARVMGDPQQPRLSPEEALARMTVAPREELVSDGVAVELSAGAASEEDGGPRGVVPQEREPKLLAERQDGAASVDAPEARGVGRPGRQRRSRDGKGVRVARRAGPFGGWGRAKRTGLGGAWEGTGARTAERKQGGIPGGGDPVYVALEKEAPLVFRQVGEEESLERWRRNGRGFWVAETETTQRQYMAVMGLELESITGQWDQPTHLVSWCDAVVYANRLSDMEGLEPVYLLDGDCELGGTVSWDTEATGFRLLSEAEWETLALQDAGDAEFAGYFRTNNVGMAPVFLAGAPEEHGIMGLRANAGEWVWGGAGPATVAPDERFLLSTLDQRRVIGRSCLATAESFQQMPSEASARPCRFEGQGHERHLAMGFRLARGDSPVR